MILLAVITGDFIRTETVSTLLGLIKGNPDMDYLIRQGPYIHENREEVVLAAQKGGYSHLFFVDWDMILGQSVPKRLLEHNKNIVAALYRVKTIPTRPVTLMEDGRQMTMEEIPKELFKCYATGAGAMMIKMSVFDKIERPWFSHDPTSKIEGEDVWFCKKAREAGFNIFVDPNIPTNHTGLFNY